MATFSETYYHQMYRDSFSNSENAEELVTLFNSARTIFSDSLLMDLKILTHQELREFKDSSRVRVSERREKQARNLVEKVRCKDCLKAYRGFRIFAKWEAERSGLMEVLGRVFPFGDKEDRDGLAPAIVSNGRTNCHRNLASVTPVGAQPAVVPVQSETPTVLWVSSTQTEFEIVKRSLNLQASNTSTRFDFIIEVY